jgi:2-polyprenyl-6-methoxyphenol hydroxylase-like FAD-dependent oxidoreductase
MADREVPIVIVGGSLVGLTASALLAAHGVPHLLVERHRGTAIHPRAASFHQRTMEIFRSVGLQQAVEDAAAREFIQNGAIVSVDSLSGRELACFYRSFNEGVEGLSPTSRLFITQVGLEPVLRRRAEELGAEMRFATDLAGFEQDESGVTVTLRPRDGGADERVRASWLIAADGAHSPVRRALDIPMEGRGGFADCATIYFRADMRAMIGDRALSVVYVNRPELLAFFRFAITNDAGFLAVFATFDSAGKREADVGSNLSSERCAGLVRIALGVAPDYPVAIDDVQPWTATAATAAAFRSGRIFLAGDAAHLMPPTGGFGGNTGVADAHNLAWKLALVERGLAGPALLDSYDVERRPLCDLIVEQAYTRYVQRVDPSLPSENLASALDDPSIELGSIYRSAAIAGADPGSDLLEDPREPTGRPGTRIPHMMVKRDGEAVSTHDLVGAGLALVAGADGGAWVEAACSLASESPLPFAVCRVGPDGDLVAPDGRFEALVGIGSEGALLLRPDGVIGWRSPGSSADPAAVLRDALAAILAV